MRTCDFIAAMHTIGLDVLDTDDTLAIRTKDGRFIASASKCFVNIVNTDSIHYRMLAKKTQDAIFEYLLRYALTAIPDREDPKYVYRFMIPIATDNRETLFIRRFEPADVKGVILDASSRGYVFGPQGARNFHFSDAEVKSYPTEVQYLFELCYKEAVEYGKQQKLLE